MIRSVFSIVVLALIGQFCAAEIDIQTSKTKHLTALCDAAIDILMTCQEDPGSAVGILGDSDGYVLEALRSNYFVPVVLMNDKLDTIRDLPRQHALQSFVVATNSVGESARCLSQLGDSIWANQFANYIFIETKFDNDNSHCSNAEVYMYMKAVFGLLNAQFVCYDNSSAIWMYDSNPFTPQAPPVWRLEEQVIYPDTDRHVSIFARSYRKGRQVCEALNFPKTIDIGGWPLRFIAYEQSSVDVLDHNPSIVEERLKKLPYNMRVALEIRRNENKWFIRNMARSLNATAVKVTTNASRYYGDTRITAMGIMLRPFYFSAYISLLQHFLPNTILPPSQMPMFVITNHTGHKTQLDKILTVIDGYSRIGMCIVYLITFVFLKWFLRQAVTSALLNLVRLTCGTGLPNLPNDLAPTIYLACLLMFVVTLQGIYTGNLATLLTTTIPYKNVQTKWDIPYLGYTVYINKGTNAKLAADPVLDGHVVEIGRKTKCEPYLFREPLAACIYEEFHCVTGAMMHNLHISRDPILQEYPIYLITARNPLGPRLRSIMTRWVEHGIWFKDPIMEKLRLLNVDDDEVMKNTDRRVMNLNDLCFAFVILGVGLLCSFICFIGEIVVFKVRLKMAQRRKGVRARLAWGVKKNYFLSIRSLNFGFNPRRLFSQRR